MSSDPKSVVEVPPPSSGVRLEGVEGLRAIAAMSIVLVHVWGFMTPGGALEQKTWIGDAMSTLATGVTLFFTLSGFLLYRPFAAAIARDVPHMTFGSYLRNRMLRIVPAYWVILVIATFAMSAVNVRDANGVLSVGRITDPMHFLQALFLLQDYNPATMVIGIGPAWSLAVEIVFYLALPLLVLAVTALVKRGMTRRQRVYALFGPPVFLLLLGLTGKYVAAFVLPAPIPQAGYENNWHSVVERSFWAQSDLFAFGMMVAALHAEVVDGTWRLPAQWRAWAFTLGLVIFAACAVTMHQGEHSYMPQNTGQALGMALMFSVVALPASTGFSRAIVGWLDRPWIVALGAASYSLFLWHHPVIGWLLARKLTLGGWGGLVVNLIVVTMISVALSMITYRFVELPALRKKKSVRQAEARVNATRNQNATTTHLL